MTSVHYQEGEEDSASDEESGNKYANNVFRNHKFYLKSDEVSHRTAMKCDRIFVQMNVLSDQDDDKEERVWKEIARWIKYEENVELNRWGRPHVSSLSFYSLINLRRLISEGVVLFNLEENDFPSIVDHIVNQMVLTKQINEEIGVSVRNLLLLKHKHVNDNEKSWKFYQQRKSISPEGHSQHLLHTTIDLRKASSTSVFEGVKIAKGNILRQLPLDAETFIVLIGTDDTLDSPLTAFVRITEGSIMENITEVPIPIKFIFILLGPSRFDLDYTEIGRSISTLMSNKEFHAIAYEAEDRKDLLNGIHEYLDESIVLPPCEYEKDLFCFDDLRLKNEALRLRKQRMSVSVGASGGSECIDKLLVCTKLLDEPLGAKPHEDSKGLVRTRQYFGGLVNDIRRRYPKYMSDIKDGFNFQCLAAIIFISCAQISGTIAFGGLIDSKTEKHMGISETLFSSSIGGIVIALLGGQPLLIAATTGPVLLFDASLYAFCQDQEINFLSMRTWIGVWLSVIGIIFVAFEASFFVRYFTRFTQEVFSSLISLLFIAESLINLFNIYKTHPLLRKYGICELDPNDQTVARVTPGSQQFNQPNTALLCTILMFGTFSIAWFLVAFRSSHFLTKRIRDTISNFAVPIAIVIMVLLDFFIRDTVTKKLDAPGGFVPTYPRGWLIDPGQVSLPVAAISILPALLLFILLFMEVAIAELILSKFEYKTVKGSGFHLDVLLICLVNTATCFIGLPWISVALVRSLAHMSSLTVWSSNNPPGERSTIIGVREQRLTNLVLSILTGASVTMAQVLGIMPVAVIFGVFLFMGVGGLSGQFVDRFALFFKQVEHHPKVPYVRRVHTSKMHLYTIIQVCWLVLLWTISYTQIALSFPIFVFLLIPFKFLCLPRIFTTEELEALDASGDERKEDPASESLRLSNETKRS